MIGSAEAVPPTTVARTSAPLHLTRSPGAFALLGALALITSVPRTARAEGVGPALLPLAPPAAASAVQRPSPGAADFYAPSPLPSQPSPAPSKPASDVDRARLDYADGVFYLRSVDDNLVLVPSARVHVDTYGFAGDGVAAYRRANGTGLTTNVQFRRFVLELGGMVRKRWFFWAGGNFAQPPVDATQGAPSGAAVYDGFVGYLVTPETRLYFGQFNAPFTMENVTSSRWLDLMERALLVRTIGAPGNKAEGLMLWGDLANRGFEYQVGVFGGDGFGRPNIDDRVDGMARLVVRPLVARADATSRLHVGASGRYGVRDNGYVRYDAASLTTPGGYAFWSSSYGAGAAETRVLPSGRQRAVAIEAYVPFERFDLRGEAIYVSEQRREVLASDRAKTQRKGLFSGFGVYGQLSIWLLGTPRIAGNPGGTYGVLRVPEGLGAQAPSALQLALRVETLQLAYDGAARGGAPNGPSAQTTRIRVNAYQAALTYWATKHIRVTPEYSLYHFPGTPVSTPGGDNLAQAPGAKGGASPNARTLHEISFRVGLAL